MIEIINILFLGFVIIIFSISPINIKIYQNYFGISKNFYFDLFTINLIFNTLLIFFVSFTKINLNLFFYVVIFFYLILNFFLIRNYKNYFLFLKNKYLFFFIFLNLIIFINLAANPTLAWDGIENWYFKAYNFYQNYNFFDLNDNRGISYYPHLGSLLWGFFWKNSYLQYEYFGRLVHVYFFLLAIFSISDLLKKDLYFKSIFSSLVVLFCFDRFLFSGYQDILIFSFLILSTKYTYNFFKTNNIYYFILAFILLNFLPWIKNEGYIFVAIFSISLIILTKFTKFEKKNILLFVIFSFLLVLMKFYIFHKYLYLNLTHGAGITFDISTKNLLIFSKHFISGIVIAIFKYKIWLIIIILFIYISKKPKLIKKDDQFIIFLKINLSLYILIFLFIYYNYVDEPRGLYWWIHTTLDRLLYSVSGSFVIIIPLLVNYIYKSKLK